LNDGGIIKVVVKEDSTLYDHPGKIYEFHYLKAIKDLVFKELVRLPKFDTKPTKKDVFAEIFSGHLKDSLIKDEFSPKDLTINYRTGTATLRTTTSKIYNDEPFDFRFYTKIASVVDSKTTYQVSAINPTSQDFINVLKIYEGNADLEFDSIVISKNADNGTGLTATIRGNNVGAYDPDDSKDIAIIKWQVNINAIFDKATIKVPFTIPEIQSRPKRLFDFIKTTYPEIK